MSLHAPPATHTAAAAMAAWREFPPAGLGDIAGPGPLLVLAPHPDDETLGCGGLIAAARAAGRKVFVAVLTDGSGSHPGSRQYPPARLAALRAREVEAALAVLGVAADRLRWLGCRDGAAPHEGAAFDGLAAALAAQVRQSGAGTLLTTWGHDPHPDHQAAFLLARAACAASGAGLVSFPVWGWTLPPATVLPGAPPCGHRLDIAAQLATKRSAVAAHASQTSALVADAPVPLSAAFLERFLTPWETYIPAGRWVSGQGA